MIESTPGSAKDRPDAPATRRPHTVVIADDDPSIRNLVAVSAGRAGGAVVAAVGDGGAAVDAVRAHDPDLVILDVSMPGMSGLEACAAIRAHSPTVPVIMLSAAVHAAAVQAGIAAGADLYLEKPFSPRALAERIRALLTARYGA